MRPEKLAHFQGRPVTALNFTQAHFLFRIPLRSARFEAHPANLFRNPDFGVQILKRCRRQFLDRPLGELLQGGEHLLRHQHFFAGRRHAVEKLARLA